MVSVIYIKFFVKGNRYAILKANVPFLTFEDNELFYNTKIKIPFYQ